MRIAFYAPLKPPDHPVPSGERLMARLLIRALEHAGHEVDLVSRFRSHSKVATGHDRFVKAGAEIEAIAARWQKLNREQIPQVWFCYHPYYKAPDLIGPELATRFGLAYVTAEASYAGKRDVDDWARMQAEVVKSVQMADANFYMTDIDREGLARIARPEQLVSLPAFIDTSPYEPERRKSRTGPCRLATVAMMRVASKLDSYRMLADALNRLDDIDWVLTVVGDGPAASDVRDAFAQLEPERVIFRGELDQAAIADLLWSSDLFAWPGIGEAYGLAYLEAQACGLPVVAQATGGVPFVVNHGETGLLTTPGDVGAYADALRQLIENESLRQKLSAQARTFVTTQRDLTAASGILDNTLKAITRR